MMLSLDAPNELPVENLSDSSVNLFLKCPEKWRKRYLEHVYEPPIGMMLMGRAVHQAEAQSYHTMVDTGSPHSIEQVLDDFATVMDTEVSTTPHVEWQDDAPGVLRDRGVVMLKSYHETIVPAVQPTHVEHPFEVRLYPDHKWVIKGVIDIIGAYDNGFDMHTAGAQDLKTVRRKINQADLDNSTQGTLYTYATMGEDEEEKSFLVHEMKPNGEVRVLETVRDRESQLRYLARIAMVARQIKSNMETGDWQGAAPGAWWCRQTSCGYYPNCPVASR
jgi:hypothetical protein